VHLIVPHNKKELGMITLHKQKYSVTNFFDSLRDLPPLDGSDWTTEEKERFHLLMYETRKDLNAVARKMKKTLNNCLSYYFGTYKQSDDYRLMKTIRLQERNSEKSDENDKDYDPNADSCTFCNEGGRLICCDSCENSYHLECLIPPLKRVPTGHWYCIECTNKKIKDVHYRLLIENDLISENTSTIRFSDDESSSQKDFDINNIASEDLEGNITGRFKRKHYNGLLSNDNSELVRTATQRFLNSMCSFATAT